MSTKKLSDKELDKYFRNILKKPEVVPFDEAAWKGMSERLATNTTSPTISPWIIVSSVIVLIILAILFIIQPYSISENQVPNTEEPTKSISENIEELRTFEDSLQYEYTITNKSTAEEASILLNQDNVASSINDGSFPIQGATFSSKGDREANEYSEGFDEKFSKNEGVSKSIVNKTSSKSQPQQEENKKSVVDEGTSSSNYTEDKQLTSQIIHPELMRISLSGAQEVDIMHPEIIDSYILPNDADSSVLDPKSNKQPTKFQVGVSLAPDLSTVEELSEFDRMGLDVGIHFEYFIADRLSITSGVLYTRKIYRTTDLSEYKLPASFWTNGIRPEQVNADCDVIDIPINIRYYAIEGSKTRLFLSAGLSSYIMLSERYDYDYADSDDPSNRWASEFNNENEHFFGVYNLSFGISRQITKKISIEVEPYLKNSFGGVGWGQVQLKSTGALFHFKYRLRTQ